MHSLFDKKPVHEQGILIDTPDGKAPSQPYYFFLGK
jgi:hypothetical protein